MSYVDQLKSLINESGLLDGFTDINGNQQGAPILQLEYLDEEKLAKNQKKRFLVVIDPSTNSAAIPSYSDDRELVVICFSKGGTVSIKDRRINDDYARQIDKYIRENYRKECLYAATSKGVGPLMRNDDSRFVREIRVRCRFNYE